MHNAEERPTTVPLHLNWHAKCLRQQNGYHAIKLDEESQPLTTFITEWGRYMYLRMPQGFIAAGDAYTRRYDEVLKDIPRKVKCVDDALLFDPTLESAFSHTWNYLNTCAENGIVLNPEKFKFCRDTVKFAGLLLTPEGISPSPEILSAIKDFPTPTDLTGARSWFGLVNQISWAYSVSPFMQPFRELVKPNNKFHWDKTLDTLFNESKEKLITATKDGIRSFDTKRTTCLQTDWSKIGIGYLLLQKYCKCVDATAPICCPDGWKLVYAGSRFISPTEGEALAVTWALDHARMFVLGCQTLIITTDHKPLLGIFCNRDLSTITNPRLLKLKSRSLRYRFTMQYCPGKWLRGPDAVSRFPTIAHIAELPLLDSIRHLPTTDDLTVSTKCDDSTLSAITEVISAFFNQTSLIQLISLDRIKNSCKTDVLYQKLIELIKKGFPTNQHDTPSDLRVYWNIKTHLSTLDNIALFDKRIIIPICMRKNILQAHQGCTSMKARATQTVYWPGLNRDIHQHRDNCHSCTQHMPSQSKEPLSLTPSPSWPFQMICADYFVICSHYYLSIVDRYSGWICIYHLGTNEANSTKLTSICRDLFTTYGAPEEFSSDRGPQFSSISFKQFLSDWDVNHRLSSAEYPQSNGRAELGVKSAKRIVRDNIDRSGSINTNSFARALLQYRNTPLPDIQLSPAQILFHRQLKDYLPSHPSHYRLHQQWVMSSKQRETMLAKRNHHLIEIYNNNTRELKPLPIGTTVCIQNRGCKDCRQWKKTGIIVETMPNRQYHIKMNGSGRITVQNR